MKPFDRYVYELTYNVDPEARDEYDAWLAETTAEWLALEQVRGIRSEHTVECAEHDVRLRFEFGSLSNWGAFVTADRTRRRLDQLRRMTDRLEVALWKPAAIPVGAVTVGAESSASE
ncbi:hypothetical protein [Halogeometricum borinquense]|uniref:hypothetical protein n=1 Tax=Halogeometricum borinquense TaxID=60847 RepID=UPI0034484114